MASSTILQVTAESLVAAEMESRVSDYIALLKPRVMSLVVFSGLIGLLLAPGTIHPFLGIIAILCIAIGSGAAGAINMWYDRDIDAVMKRTQNRPIPTGRVLPEEALHFGVTLAAGSVVLLGIAVNWMAAFVLAFAIFFYVGIYTMWLKRSTPQNIVIGGASGAFPPIIGWVAVTGSLALEPILMFLVIFLWTPPHFWALALYRSEDYAKAGVPMYPVIFGDKATKKQMLYYTVLLVGVTLLPVYLGMFGAVYAVIAGLLGAEFLRLVIKLQKEADNKTAPRTFGYSIMYLFLVLSAMLVDKFAYIPLHGG